MFRSILATPLLALLLPPALLAGGAGEAARPPDWPKGRLEFRELFRGTDLEGWAVEGKGRWAAADGCIVGQQDPTTRGESWLFTTEEFGDFVLLVKFQITRGGNSGIFLRIPRVPGHPAHLAYEMQIWDADPDYPTGSFYAVAKGPPGLQKPGEWNEAQIVCVGSRLFTAVNGRVALAIDNRRRARGRIGFQVHGGAKYANTVVRFKDIWLAPLDGPALPERGKSGWKKVKLDDGAHEAAAVADVNGDGRLDVLCGHQWYANPTWKPAPLREADRPSTYELACDVNADGHVDLIAGGGLAQDESWFENPKSAKLPWPPRELFPRRGPIEDMLLLDLDGDGRLNDLLPNGNGRKINWIHITLGESPKVKTRELGSYGRSSGIGYGDVNGDGRIDILTPRGWWEAPADRARDRWTWHSDFKLEVTPGVPIRTLDVNGDGKADIVYGNAIGYGLWWLEQGVDDQGKPAWTPHAIDESFSQAYRVELADINRDGRTDLIAGKRWRAHQGRDEGACEPTCLFWFEHEGKGEAWTRHIIDYNGGSGCGTGLQVVDIDGDRRPDVVAPGRGGLYLYLNQGAR
jgi:hypothetical protein